jgi:molecular chaperone DnaJ
MKDYYAILGVPRDADLAEIREAFRCLVKKCHPDSSQNTDTVGSFIDVQEAYDVLRDAGRRREYNYRLTGGDSGDRVDSTANSRPGATGWSTPFTDRRGTRRHWSERGPQWSDLFGRGFGARRGSADSGTAWTEPGTAWTEPGTAWTEPRTTGPDTARGFAVREPVELDLILDGGEARRGGRFDIPFADETVCPRCNGAGSLLFFPCTACSGRGSQVREVTVTVDIPPGVRSGARLLGYDRFGLSGSPVADVRVIVKRDRR